MDILYLIIPLSLLLVGLIVAAFLWAIRSGQFEDLEGPAHRILLDDDEEDAPGTGPDASPGPRDEGDGSR